MLSVRQGEEEEDSGRPQRSPSAPLFSSVLCEHNERLMCSFDVNDDLLERRRGTSRRQRSLSADGADTSLRRGRPNTIRAGLPSPVNRQTSDPIDCRIPVMSVDDGTVVLDTSPIHGESDQLTHQVSKDSLRSLASDSALDQAFIVSVADSVTGDGDIVTADADSIMTTSGIDLDTTESSVDEPGEVAIDNQVLTLTGEVPGDPMHRCVTVLPRRPPSVAVTNSGSLSTPRIKPSLMPANVTSRLLNKVNCSPRDSPVRSGRLIARSSQHDPHSY